MNCRCRGLIVCLLVSTILFNGCSMKRLETSQAPQAKENRLTIPEQIEIAMQAGKILYDAIDHIEVVDEGVLVFYEYEDNLFTCDLKLESSGWKFNGSIGSVPVKGGNGYTTVGSVLGTGEIKTYYRYGVLTDSRIERITLNGEQAKIVTAQNGTKIWFLINEKELGAPIEMKCLGKDGKVLYKDKR